MLKKFSSYCTKCLTMISAITIIKYHESIALFSLCTRDDTLLAKNTHIRSRLAKCVIEHSDFVEIFA